MNKLTFKEKVLLMLGYKYLANTETKEIHDVRNLHRNCHKELMSNNSKKYLTLKGKNKLIASGEYNGCRWCMKLVDIG